MNYNELVGKLLQDIYMTDSAYLKTDGGIYKFVVDGDCCSWSYFADVHTAGVGGRITKAEEIFLDSRDGVGDEQECVQSYCIRITTDCGTVDLVFRNESNGYYGGWANLMHVDEIPKEAVLVEGDWSR